VNSNYRIAATLYSLGTWCVSGMYVEIPCMMMMMIMIIPTKLAQAVTQKAEDIILTEK
jgi:hypothetical protein